MELDYGSFSDLVEEKKQALLKSAKAHLSKDKIDLIKLALTVAGHAHFGQTRKSGEPYITHPIEVATIISNWNLDEQTIAGALLHDVVEDTEISKADIAQVFGGHIAELVDGVTKLEKLNFESEEIAHAEYFRKVVLAMAKDIRVILIKLADRLHNMLTLGAMRVDKRRRIAIETMEIYVPIANRIGLHRVHLQLANECLRHLHPNRYSVIAKAVENAQNKIAPLVDEILTNIRNALKSNGIGADFTYRKRSVYNLYSRMKKSNLNFNRIYNIFEVKIVTEKIGDCYLILGVLHNLYRPLPGKFKDFIAIPKSNGYQSLHSTLMGPSGRPLEVHIRTREMEDIAENGIISQWLKQQNNNDSNNFTSAKERTHSWINNILDIQSSTFSAHEFLNSIKQDLSPGDIYVFTPKGKIVLLPRNSTPLDFAYYIHSNVGNHCAYALVNQKPVKLETRLHNGDIVEIITSESVEPNDSWLDIVASGKATSRIKQYLKEQKYDENLENGENLIINTVKIFDDEISITDEILNEIITKNYPKLALNDLKHQIGMGNISALKIARTILNYAEDKILVIYTSRCKMPIIQDIICLALPGDDLFAKITHHNEVLIHKQNCKQASKILSGNWENIQIINDADISFSSKVQIFLLNQPGTFNKLTELIARDNMNMIEISQESYNDDYALVTIKLGVKNKEQIDSLFTNFSQQPFISNPKLL